MSRLSYKSAGVDIDAGQALVDAIKPLCRSTRRPGAMDDIGGFGGCFDPRAAGFVDPILVAATDGVGTKLKLAIACGRYDTVGVDLVAMCVNDLVVQGAEPLFFLDYYAAGHLSVGEARDVIAGIAEGCRQAGCALIGGETAELPGLYAGQDFDLAGFAVGAAERGRMLPRADIAAGDVLLGLASTGVHSNGYSLVRRIVEDEYLAYADPAPFEDSVALGEALLRPTRIYVGACLAAHRAGGLKALAHITGGGLIDNIPRVLPDGLGCIIDVRGWPLPPVFGWLARAGGLDSNELARTFNCGIGMVAVVASADAAAVAGILRTHGEHVIPIGRVIDGDDGPRVRLEGVEQAWKN